ncbi:DUF3320 domain-containing protein [Nonomuraea endophytica]|uniref:DUF3320 domain-containing protein n=1 Tax=Nonomuraea endophytica TaxID=714136 RepID=UPI0037C7383F
MTRALRKLYRDTSQIFTDTGLWVLALGAGFLEWSEDGSEPTFSAPLMLEPVRLERAKNSFRIKATEEDDTIPNPALAVKMELLGVKWPAQEEMEDLPSTLAAVTKAIEGHPNWRVSDRVVLATFQSHKETMYRDLLDNEDRVLSSPLVAAVALSGDPSPLTHDLIFDPPELGDLDKVQPPEDSPLVLDADSSQRQCIVAAVDGRSFVMDGPPGTGKSQTIANMIGALLHAGRTVLFVSEKAAALDVVRNRLTSKGLESFLLPLHSHNTSRKHVAQELGKALSERTKATAQAPDRERLRTLRTELSGYAEAVNRTRRSLDRSLHEVLGRLAQLDGVANLPPGRAFDAAAMSDRQFQEILVAARDVARAWRPVVEGEAFLWRGLSVTQSPQAHLDRLAEQHRALGFALEPHFELEMSDPGRVAALVELLSATSGRPALPTDWLTIDDLTVVRTALSEFSDRRDALRMAEDQVVRQVGARWERLPGGLDPQVPGDELALSALAPQGVDISALTARQADEVGRRFSETASKLRTHQASLADIAHLYGVAVPTTVEDALQLCRLAEYATAQHKPDAAWLNPASRAGAQASARLLESVVNALFQARSAASGLFNENVLTSPELVDVAQRFATQHRGLKKLSGTYRQDKRYVAGLTKDGSWTAPAAERLSQAVTWQAAQAEYTAAVAEHASALAAYWNGESTDFGLVCKMLDAAQQIQQLATAVDSPRALHAQIAWGGSPNAAAATAAASIRADLEHWQAALVPAPHPGGRPQLNRMPIADVVSWYQAHLGPLSAGIALIRQVDLVDETNANTLNSARTKITLVGRTWRARADFAAHEAADRTLLSELYQGARTDQQSIDAAFGWAERVRAIAQTHLSEQAAHALLASSPDPRLADAYATYVEAVDDLAGLFDATRGPALRSALLGTAPAAEETLERLLADRGGAEEWRDYSRGRAGLGAHGLADLIDRAAAQSTTPREFADVVEVSVLRSWVEHQLTTDPDLSIVRGTQRDALVDEFRELDLEVIAGSYAKVIDACNSRMPNAFLGPAAVIRTEAEKKTRHMPVRTLLDRAAGTVQLIKPCFMMSPLTVSQFLPADFTFDVVIFDEASQVMPHDAINCIYRGKSLIIAGDQKQMPPTNFFGTTESDNDEYDEEAPDSFESLLDLCKASGQIRSLPLRWHYRSRHEGLIAFSNHEFYEGNLVTFPGPHTAGSDVGVTFTKVPGEYQRGASRTNPIEAAAVAKRVLEHFHDRPEESLGVVAMSEAQARAIEDAVEKARLSRPELDRFFTDGRLDGFFVKNLETVQGDERDTIILSVGYGPDKEGKLGLNFGPLNRADGWRRLNVAVTRARSRVEVVSSFSGSDIPDSANKSRQHFKRYLEYAERGPNILTQQGGDVPSTAFEQSIADVIRGWGYGVVEQVGVAGYRIDLAIEDPDDPGRFALGVECDGPMYHSSPVTRDRDRLRDQVLRSLGWNTYRLWATDWYRDREGAELRLRAAIEDALAMPEPPVPIAPVSEPAPVLVESVTPEPASWGKPYVRAYARTIPGALPDMHLPEAQPMLRSLFYAITADEGPIHRDVLFQRIREAWGVGRLGPRIMANLDEVLGKMARREEAVLDGDFVSVPNGTVVARHPDDGVERKIGQIAPGEREVALLGVIGDCPGISQDEVIAEVARFFGWKRLSAEITATLEDDLRRLSDSEAIIGFPEQLGLGSNAV